MWAFSIRTSRNVIEGTLEYRRAEYSINFTPYPSFPEDGPPIHVLGTTSIALGTLQIEIDVDTRRLLYVWGYFPKALSTRQSLKPGIIESGEVVLASPDVRLVRGVAVGYEPSALWDIGYDESTGWVHFGSSAEGQRLVKIASDTALALEGQELRGVWMRPIIS